LGGRNVTLFFASYSNPDNNGHVRESGKSSSTVQKNPDNNGHLRESGKSSSTVQKNPDNNETAGNPKNKNFPS